MCEVTMGQRLTPQQRRQLQSHREVLTVSEEHLVLRDGTVLDPVDFAFRREPAVAFVKLIQCNCGEHPEGLRLGLYTQRVTNIYGQQRFLEVRPEVCPTGFWQVEEHSTEPAVLRKIASLRSPPKEPERIEVARQLEDGF